jgi:hypothetical protein
VWHRIVSKRVSIRLGYFKYFIYVYCKTSLNIWHPSQDGHLITETSRGYNNVARMWRLYKTGIGLTTGFIGSHTVTHNYSAYTLQITTVHYNTCRVFFVSSLVACLPMPLGPFTFRTNLQLCNSSLKTAASLTHSLDSTEL